MKKQVTLKPMSWQDALETVVLLSMYLKTYSPLIAALGKKDTKAIKQELLMQFTTALHEDGHAFEDVKHIIRNLIGAAVDDVNFADMPELFRVAWKLNKMDDAFRVGLALNLIDKEDLARSLWVAINWKR